MFRAITETVEKFVTDPSGRRVGVWAAVLVLVFAVFLGFEWYTNHFRLNRISEQISVAERLKELQSDPAMERDSALQAAYRDLRSQLRDSVNRPTILTRRWQQALLAFSPWALFILLSSVWSEVRPEEGLGSLIFGVLVVGIPFAAVGYFLPPSWPGAVTHLIYPFGGSLTALVAVTVWGQAVRAES